MAANAAASRREAERKAKSEHGQQESGGGHLGNLFGNKTNAVAPSDFGKEAHHILDADDPAGPTTKKMPYQAEALKMYLSSPVQLFVAFLIFLNFIISAIASQIHPQDGTTTGFVFFIFEWFFGLIFSVELVWNMYGSWFRDFWSSGWNWFDFIIVMISMMALTMSGLPGIAILRLFRAFRVFRLFKRIESLRMIIEGVIASLPGVMNAFLVLGILMGIWSIMGVEFFGEVAEQEFGDFGRGMWTMWQTMTMDSWSSGIARPIIFDSGLVVGIPFFISFIFIGGIVMTNVVVAILLDKYLEVSTNQKQAKAAKKEQKEQMQAADREQQKTMSTISSDNSGSNSGQVTPTHPTTMAKQSPLMLEDWEPDCHTYASSPSKPPMDEGGIDEFVLSKLGCLDQHQLAQVIQIASGHLRSQYLNTLNMP